MDRDRLYRKIGFRLLPLLFIGYVVANLDRNNVAFAKLDFLPALGFNQSIFGIGAGLFYVGYVVCEIPSNLLLARIGVRLTFSRIMALWFLFSFAMAFIRQPWHYYVCRALLGGAEAGYLPGVLLYFSQWAPRSRCARFTALFMLAIPVSGMIGAPIAGGLMHGLDGVLGLAGWRWLFLVEAVPAGILAIVFYRYLLDSTTEAPWLSDAERRIIGGDLAEDHHEEALPAAINGKGGHEEALPVINGKSGDSRDSSLSALKNPDVYMIGLQAFALLASLNGLNLWGPTILRDAGVGSVLHIAFLASLPQTVGIIALLVNAELSDRRGERRHHTAICSLAAAVGWLLLPSLHGQPMAALILLILIAAGIFGATAPFWSIPSQYLQGRSAAAGIALVTTMGGLGAMVSPFIVGWLSDRTGSLGAGEYFYAAAGLMGVPSLLFGTRRMTQEASTRAPGKACA